METGCEVIEHHNAMSGDVAPKHVNIFGLIKLLRRSGDDTVPLYHIQIGGLVIFLIQNRKTDKSKRSLDCGAWTLMSGLPLTDFR